MRVLKKSLGPNECMCFTLRRSHDSGLRILKVGRTRPPGIGGGTSTMTFGSGRPGLVNNKPDHAYRALQLQPVLNPSWNDWQDDFWSENCVLCILTCKCAARHSGVPCFTSQLPNVVRGWCVLYILTCKFASPHSGMEFLISQLNSDLRTRRFSEPTFRPTRTRNHWKNPAIRGFPNISRTYIFFLVVLRSSDSASLLCFSFLHIFGS